MTESWVVRYWPDDSMPGKAGYVLAVCATRELALSIRTEMRDNGFTSGRLGIDYVQTAQTHEQALTIAFRWLDVLRKGATA